MAEDDLEGYLALLGKLPVGGELSPAIVRLHRSRDLPARAESLQNFVSLAELVNRNDIVIRWFSSTSEKTAHTLPAVHVDESLDCSRQDPSGS
jgi:hypothetical protein